MSTTTTVTPGADRRQLLAEPGERAHSVQLYRDLEFLTRAVSHYAGTGLARGEAVILVTTPDHRQAISNRLAASGFDVEQLRARGQITLLDAAVTLSQFMAHGRPDRDRFMPLMGQFIDQSRANGRGSRIRAYGEMVNLLWEAGELAAALELEALWNELGTTRPFSLHCAYAMDAFDRATCCGPLNGVHHAHSHLIPVEDYPRYEAAVNRALSDVLGPTEAVVLKSVLVARQRSGSQMPGSQAAILGLSELLPLAADAVLWRARRYYHEPPGRAAAARSATLPGPGSDSVTGAG